MSFRGTNASSGMGVADHSKSTYLELQRKKVHRYVIFKIDEKKKEVVVEKTGVYDFDFVTSENLPKEQDLLHRMVTFCVPDPGQDAVCHIQGQVQKGAGRHSLRDSGH
ncbi:hypothetical protein F0562_000489 [Nyssa sinensis]|uniref:ADF-H domain-containing protein n=1 Tax=Nyssa sinensis TaxID=561372 RepID=A0A5J5C0A3_9ASTE|nr:hypothetical protein F0562_000489 [Nyssa sinensis]